MKRRMMTARDFEVFGGATDGATIEDEPVSIWLADGRTDAANVIATEEVVQIFAVGDEVNAMRGWQLATANHDVAMEVAAALDASFSELALNALGFLEVL